MRLPLARITGRCPLQYITLRRAEVHHQDGRGRSLSLLCAELRCYESKFVCLYIKQWQVGTVGQPADLASAPQMPRTVAVPVYQASASARELGAGAGRWRDDRRRTTVSRGVRSLAPPPSLGSWSLGLVFALDWVPENRTGIGSWPLGFVFALYWVREDRSGIGSSSDREAIDINVSYGTARDTVEAGTVVHQNNQFAALGSTQLQILVIPIPINSTLNSNHSTHNPSSKNDALQPTKQDSRAYLRL